jgi:hypothetical protein
MSETNTNTEFEQCNMFKQYTTKHQSVINRHMDRSSTTHITMPTFGCNNANEIFKNKFQTEGFIHSINTDNNKLTISMLPSVEMK